jgi:hypothetical protein
MDIWKFDCINSLFEREHYVNVNCVANVFVEPNAYILKTEKQK